MSYADLSDDDRIAVRARTGDDFNLMMSLWRGHEIEST